MRKGDKRLKYEDRKEIEKMKNDGVRVVVIAEKIGVHRATIYNELKRGGTPYRAEVVCKLMIPLIWERLEKELQDTAAVADKKIEEETAQGGLLSAT